MDTDIEFLRFYRDQLVHQREHGGESNFSYLHDTILGPAQPWDVCMECLRERREGLDLRPHAVKRRYSWAVPDEGALDTIAARSPRGVVEIGAGGGYWTYELRRRGVDVIAYDPDPVGGGERGWHDGAWTDVLKGDHGKVTDHPDRTLFLCWPSYDDPWAAEAVEAYEGDTIIYIGEGPGGCTGDDRLHALLGDDGSCWHGADECDCEPVPEARFREVVALSIPQWWGLHDRLYIYERITSPAKQVGA